MNPLLGVTIVTGIDYSKFTPPRDMYPLHSCHKGPSVAVIGHRGGYLSSSCFLTTIPPRGPLPLGQVPMLLLTEALLLPEDLSHHQGLNGCHDMKG